MLDTKELLDICNDTWEKLKECIEQLLKAHEESSKKLRELMKLLPIWNYIFPRKYGISLKTGKNRNRPCTYGYIKSFERNLPYQRRFFS